MSRGLVSLTNSGQRVGLGRSFSCSIDTFMLEDFIFFGREPEVLDCAPKFLLTTIFWLPIFRLFWFLRGSGSDVVDPMIFRPRDHDFWISQPIFPTRTYF